MRTTPIRTYDPPDLIPTIWPIKFWLIDASTPVLSPLLNIDASNLKPNVVTNELNLEVAIKVEDESLSTTIALVSMDPYRADALIGLVATVSYRKLSSKSDTLIDIAASLNFVSNEFVMANGFYKDC